MWGVGIKGAFEHVGVCVYVRVCVCVCVWGGGAAGVYGGRSFVWGEGMRACVEVRGGGMGGGRSQAWLCACVCVMRIDFMGDARVAHVKVTGVL